MRILIVDDEPLARGALTRIVEARGDVEDYDTACDAVEAFDKIGRRVYDVVILDIGMPEVSGLVLLDRLKEARVRVPAVVFVTAFEEHAVTAFARHAVDYVLKPFSTERINEALDLAFERNSVETLAKLSEFLPQLQGIVAAPTARIAIKGDGRILFIDPSDVVAVQAEGNYVLLQREVGSHLLRESISVMADKLRPYGFIRIHRSVLVNSAFVREIRPWTTGEYGLLLKSGKEYTVTRTHKKNLREIASSWIGTDVFSSQ
jgi:two-component system, LytTR family, response regulator